MDSPAYRCGVRQGDVIVTVDDWLITVMDRPQVIIMFDYVCMSILPPLREKVGKLCKYLPSPRLTLADKIDSKLPESERGGAWREVASWGSSDFYLSSSILT